MNMTELDVKTRLFILEGEAGFEDIKLREKMTQVAILGNHVFRDWFYTRGIEKDFPENWADFKQMV
jgi:hypothetical protein